MRTCIIILVLLYQSYNVKADGTDSPAMVEALQAADLNYEQDRARDLETSKDEQIRALQDQINNLEQAND